MGPYHSGNRSLAMRTAAWAAIGLSLGGVGAASAGTTYYVDPAGDDGWAGTSPTPGPPDGPKATIQAAIGVAVDGDEIVLAEATHNGPGNRNVDFSGKAITVRGADPNDPNVVAATIIDAQDADRGVIFQTGEDANSVLAGLTITNGRSQFGSGIWCNSSPTITNCTITGCKYTAAGGDGGGIYSDGGSPTITNCTIIGNSLTNLSSNGGGIYCNGGSPLISNCTITENSASLANDAGGAIYLSGGTAMIMNCTIAGNSAGAAGGGIYCAGGNLTITNSILWGNGASTGAEIYTPGGGSNISVSYSTVQGGRGGAVVVGDDTLNWGPGNSVLDPSFADSDYRLKPDSPCIDAGDPGFVAQPGQTDLDGNPRVVRGRVDMGSHEVGFGTLSVVTKDQDGQPVLGQITVNGEFKGTWSWSDEVASGAYTVSFGDLLGYFSTPADQDVTVQNGLTTEVTGSYVQELAVAAVADPNTIASGQSSTLTATPSGGKPPFTYAWNTGQAGATLTVAPTETTTYTVTATDSLGQTAQAQVTVVSLLGVTAQADPNPIVPDGSTTLTATASGGKAPYTYAWNTGQAGGAVTVTPAETTTYTVTATDSFGQTAQAEVTATVEAPGPLSASVQADPASDELSPGSQVALTAKGMGGLTPYSYSWNTGETSETIHVRPMVTTTYTVTITDAVGQTATTDVTVRVAYRLTVRIDGPGEVGRPLQLSPIDRISFEPGETVTLSAIPQDRFLGWQGDVTSTDAQITVVMDSDKQITAKFADELTGPICFGPGVSLIGLIGLSAMSVARPARRRVQTTRDAQAGRPLSGGCRRS